MDNNNKLKNGAARDFSVDLFNEMEGIEMNWIELKGK